MIKTLARIIKDLKKVRDDLESDELDNCIYDLIQWGIKRGVDLQSQKENLEDAITRPARLV